MFAFVCQCARGVVSTMQVGEKFSIYRQIPTLVGV